MEKSIETIVSKSKDVENATTNLHNSTEEGGTTTNLNNSNEEGVTATNLNNSTEEGGTTTNLNNSTEEGVTTTTNLNNSTEEGGTTTNLHNSTEEGVSTTNLNNSTEEGDTTTNLNNSTEEGYTTTNLNNSTEEGVSTTNLNNSTEEGGTTTNLHKSTEEGGTTTNLNNSTEEGDTTTNLNNSNEEGVSTTNLNNSTEEGVSTTNLNNSTEEGVTTTNLNNSTEEGVSTTNLNNSTDEGDTTTNLNNSTEEGVSTTNLNNSTEEGGTTTNLNNSTEEGVSTTNLNNSTEEGVSTTNLNNSTEEWVPTTNLNNSTEEGGTTTNLNNSTEEGVSTTILNNTSEDEDENGDEDEDGDENKEKNTDVDEEGSTTNISNYSDKENISTSSDGNGEENDSGISTSTNTGENEAKEGVETPLGTTDETTNGTVDQNGKQKRKNCPSPTCQDCDEGKYLNDKDMPCDSNEDSKVERNLWEESGIFASDVDLITRSTRTLNHKVQTHFTGTPSSRRILPHISLKSKTTKKDFTKGSSLTVSSPNLVPNLVPDTNIQRLITEQTQLIQSSVVRTQKQTKVTSGLSLTSKTRENYSTKDGDSTLNSPNLSSHFLPDNYNGRQTNQHTELTKSSVTRTQLCKGTSFALCYHCNYRNMALYSCEDCMVNCCSVCIYALHPRQTRYKDHTILTGHTVLRCKVHDEPLSWYCLTCDVPICAMSLALSSHALHDVEKVETYVKNEKKQLLESYRQIGSRCLEKAHINLTASEEYEETLRLEWILKKQQIKQEFASLRKVIGETEDRLIDDGEKAFESRLRRLNSMRLAYGDVVDKEARLAQMSLDSVSETTKSHSLQLVENTKKELSYFQQQTEAIPTVSLTGRVPSSAPLSLFEVTTYLKQLKLSLGCSAIRPHRRVIFVPEIVLHAPITTEELWGMPNLSSSVVTYSVVIKEKLSNKGCLWEGVVYPGGVLFNGPGLCSLQGHCSYMLKVTPRYRTMTGYVTYETTLGKPCHIFIITAMEAMDHSPDTEILSQLQISGCKLNQSFEEARHEYRTKKESNAMAELLKLQEHESVSVRRKNTYKVDKPCEKIKEKI